MENYYKGYEKINNIVKQSKLLLDTPQKMENLYSLIIKRQSHKIAAQYFDDNNKLKSYTYHKMDQFVKNNADYILYRVGEDKIGSRIVLKIANSQKWGEIFFGTLMAGFVPVMVDAKASKEGTENIIKQSHAVALICDDNKKYDVIKISTFTLYDGSKREVKPHHWADEAIFCSSGTTGDVKMMVFNGHNFISQICLALDMAKTTHDIMYTRKDGKVKLLIIIPFHHIFGFVADYLWFIYYGATFVYPTSLTPSDIQSIALKAKVSHVFSVPLFWNSLTRGLVRKVELMDDKKKDLFNKYIAYNLGKIDKKEAGLASSKMAKNKIQNMLLGNHIKFCISGGGFISADTSETINGIGYPLYNGFGMTEIGVTSVELSPSINQRLKCSIGKPLHDVTYALDNVNKDGKGELLVKSPTIHIREIIGGVEKDTVLDENGFFHTGDICEKDENGYYYICGRIKDIIINEDGENIFPDELELFFKDMPHVSNYSILGVKAEKEHEEKVVIVLEFDNTTKNNEIEETKALIEKLSLDLPHHVKISDIFVSKNKLPMANNMKVKRFMVKKAIESKSDEYFSLYQKIEEKTKIIFSEETINTILKPVKNIFSEVLILPEFKIDNDAHWINDLGGDSMSYVELIQKLQEQFNITFKEETLGQMACVDDFTLEIEKLLKEGK